MIEIQNISKTYHMGDNVVTALANVSLRIDDGDFVAIMGPSGSGKSTLMHILGLLDVPESGSYKLGGNEVSHLSEDELAILRRDEIGFIFQQFNLLPRMNAAENVALPLLYSEKKLNVTRATEFLELVGLGTRADHRPNELSGGQQQRVAIARALINRPRMILADEPTGNLDSTSEKDIMTALKQLNEQGITIVIVTHEEEIGMQAKRLVRMRDGNVQSDERLAPFTPTAELRLKENKNPESVDGVKILEIFEHFRQGFKSLAANKVRTALSMLGILIGVGAVVAMLALGQGAQKAIEAQLASLGSNLLVLRPGAVKVGGVAQGAGSVTRLTNDDADAIKLQIPAVTQSGAIVNGKGQLTYQGKNWNTQVTGVVPAYAQMHAAEPSVGKFITDEQNKKRSLVAVIGRTIVNQLFDGKDPVGEMIKINKTNFLVIGVLPEKGATGFRDQDDIVLVPVLTAMHRLMGKEFVDSIDIEVDDSTHIEATQEKVFNLMFSRHRVPLSQQQDAFQVRNMADIQEALSQSSKTMSVLLSSIAAISLLVGGIGIMNIMLVSVTERTKEIGLRKAIGARKIDILLQFLVEAVAVSGLGGTLGIGLGFLITSLMSAFAGWATSISLESVVLAVVFSGTIGIVFGIYPARKASSLHPIQALRFE